MNNRVISLHGANLHVHKTGEAPNEKEWLIFRGVIDSDSLSEIGIPEYQRDVLIGRNQKRLVEAISGGVVPDIVLGMRGSEYSTVEVDSLEVFKLTSPVFVIDGLQRLSAAKIIASKENGKPPQLGAMIYVDTTEEFERSMFIKLNQCRVKVSPNVLIFNARHDNPLIDTTYNLVESTGFILTNRIQWCQIMKREHLITSLNLFRVIGALHSRFGAGGISSSVSDITDANSSLARLTESVGRNTVRENVRTFFGLIDESFGGIKNVHYSGRCHFMKGTFLCALASFLTQFDCFWDEKRLTIDRATRKKIAKFPINDPNIASLSGGNHTSQGILKGVIIEFINSGRRKNRLDTSSTGELLANGEDTVAED